MSISKRNRRGAWALILCCVALSYLPRLVSAFESNEVSVSYEELELIDQEIVAKSQKKRRSYSKKQKKSYRRPACKFDPNTYSEADWMKLGLSAKQANVILKFGQRGIRSNEDLEKIFVLPAELFVLIKDSTFYEVHEKQMPKFERTEKKIAVVDLNSADKEALMQLPGIGEYYAAKILEYRTKLGGFTGKHQLLEIWKFDSERYDKIKEYVLVDGNIQKININTADLETLKQHPYISYTVANSIVKMRAAHGAYKRLDDLLRSAVIDQELFSKIQPYLTL